MFSVLVIRLRSLRLLRVSGIVMRLRMFLLLITFLKASHSFRNRLLVICKNAYLFATMIMTSVSSPFSCCSGIVIHITIIELNALHTKRQNLFQELDAVIHLLMEAKHWGLRKSRNATSLNSRFKSLDTLKVKIISVTFRRVIRTNHKKASKIWRHENIQLGGCQS